MVGPQRLARPVASRPYSNAEDVGECRKLHRRFGTSYFFSTCFFPPEIRRRTHALYGFVRVADEFADDLESAPPEDRARSLAEFRSEFLRGLEGIRPASPVLRAFCDLVEECWIPVEEPLVFLDAMESDFEITRYESYRDLQNYMRGSAVSVGRMMCSVVGAERGPTVDAAARALAEAMQLTNFLRDIGEDLDRGRLYLPLEDFRSFGLDPAEVFERRVTPQFLTLMRFEIARAHALYAEARGGIGALPLAARKPVQIAATLYENILDRIEENGYDVFAERARTSKLQKLRLALPILAKRNAAFEKRAASFGRDTC
jgi:15-cis-phytoene synthase